jgi:hypothetical protein
MSLRLPALLLVSVACGAAAPTLFGQDTSYSYYGTPRQYYSEYQYVPSHGYGYRTYYYKPTPTYAGYQHHYVIYPKYDPHHGYYYNPEKQAYWGRCPTHCHGTPAYSLLDPIHRKSTLAAIPPSAFPSPGPVPAIPGSTDGAKLDLAPDNTPIPGAVTGPAGTPAAAALAAGAPPAGAPPAGGPGAAPPPGLPPGTPVAASAPPDAPPPGAAGPPPTAPMP